MGTKKEMQICDELSHGLRAHKVRALTIVCISVLRCLKGCLARKGLRQMTLA